MQANDEEIHVVPRSSVPPCYMMLPTFPGIRPLFTDLDLPNNPDEIFCSIFVSGSHFVGRRAKGAKRKHLQKFTVELFGVVISDNPIVEGKEPELPDSRQYACPPKYWRTSLAELIQIWRTRIFSNVMSDFTPSQVTPLTPYRPIFPYLEKHWHPQLRRPRKLMGGFESFSSGFSLLEDFHNKAQSILNRNITNAGRPRVFESREQFMKDVKEAYLTIWREKKRAPLQKEVAARLGCKLSTFKDYWGGMMPWHWLFDLWINK